MPLYDFACSACGAASTLLLKYEDAPGCPACGSTRMERRMAPCGATGFAASPAAGAAKAAIPQHLHSAGCGCGPTKSAPQACASGAKADALIKKYLD